MATGIAAVVATGGKEGGPAGAAEARERGGRAKACGVGIDETVGGMVPRDPPDALLEGVGTEAGMLEERSVAC